MIRPWVLGPLVLLGGLLLAGCFTPGSKVEKSSSDSALRLDSRELFEGNFAANSIFSVMEARGELWVGTSNGLFTFQLKTYKPLNSYLVGQKVIDLAVGQSATVYAAVEDKGLFYLPVGESKFYAVPGGKPRKITIAPGTDDVYCATANGIGLWSNSMWIRIEVQANGEFASRANDVTSLAFDHKGALWIGTNFGVYRKTGNKFDFYYGNYQIIQGNSVVNHAGNSALSGNLVFDIRKHPSNNQLLFSTNGGLSLLLEPDQASSASSWMTYTGDHTQTVMHMGELQERPTKGNSPLTTNFINNALGFSDYLLIGTDNGLFFVRDRQFVRYSLENQLAGDTIHDLYHVSNVDNDVVYIATNGGLSVLNVAKAIVNDSRSKSE